MRRSCGSCSWAGGSKRTSAAPRTSNGAWSTMASRSSRAGRSPRCSPSPRPATHPDVVAFLQHVEDEGFLDELPKLAGGREARDAIRACPDKYGMRCVGEIDITKPRWSERPTTLVPLILGNVKNFEPGAGGRRFEQGRQETLKKEQELLERLRALPDGERKAEEAKQMIDRVRTFIGYREYPKYGIVSRYFVYKQALLEEAERLVQAHVLREKEDIFYLTFQELRDVVRTNQVDDQLICQRKDAFRSYQALDRKSTRLNSS